MNINSRILTGLCSALLLATSANAQTSTFNTIIENGLALSKDKFANQKDVPSLPTAQILIPFTDGENRYPTNDTSAFWVYKNGILELSFSTRAESNILERAYPEPYHYWLEAVVYSELKPVGSFVGQNAYGAATKVDSYNLRTVQISFWESEVRAVKKINARIPLPPKDAKHLINVAAVEITLADPGQLSGPAECKHTIHTASIRHPSQVDDLECTVAAKVKSIRVIRTDTGEEIEG